MSTISSSSPEAPEERLSSEPAPALFARPLMSVPKPVAITVTTISSSSFSSNATPKMMFASASAAAEMMLEAT